MTFPWNLRCSACYAQADATGLPTVCTACGAPWLVEYDLLPSPTLKHELGTRPWSMWRYREWLPLLPEESPLSLGEGGTPLLRLEQIGTQLGVSQLFLKDESQNPTGSFKARGLAAAVTRAKHGGAPGFVVPTAGNAGVALAAYARKAGLPARVFAPRTTPPRILQQICRFGAELDLVDGHIGDCGRAARAYARTNGLVDVSTLREPYRIEGKKTLGLEIAEQLGWTLPDAIVYPTGGGTGLIGMWRAFVALEAAGWVSGNLPRLYSVQAAGCAPIVRAAEEQARTPRPWDRPETVAAGLRVPAPLGGSLILEAIAATRGGAVAVSDNALRDAQARLARDEGIDACPEGGAALAGLARLLQSGAIRSDETVIVFNTGAGWLYET